MKMALSIASGRAQQCRAQQYRSQQHRSAAPSRACAPRGLARLAPALLVASLLAVGLQLPLAVSAPSHASADNRAEARTLFNKGVEAFNAGRFQDALEAFSGAYRLAPHPSVRVNMANCFRELGQPVEALFNFERFISESGDQVDPAQVEEVRSRIEELKVQIGYLKVSVVPATAMVLVDGQPAHPDVTGKIALSAGRHQVSISAPGYDTDERNLRIKAQKTTLNDVELRRGAPALVESSTDGPAEEDTLDELAEEEGADALGAPASTPLFSGNATFGLSTPVLLTGGGAVVLAVGATITGIMALGAQNDFEAAVDVVNDPTVEPIERELVRQEGYDHASRADTLAAVTDVLIAATAVSAGAAVALWWLDRPDSENSPGGMTSEDLDDSELDLSRNVHPWATPSAAGLMIHGSF